MQPHINNSELRRLFAVAQLLLEAQLQQQASEADTDASNESDNADQKGENNNDQES
jgi:hypothetical protein